MECEEFSDTAVLLQHAIRLQQDEIYGYHLPPDTPENIAVGALGIIQDLAQQVCDLVGEIEMAALNSAHNQNIWPLPDNPILHEMPLDMNVRRYLFCRIEKTRHVILETKKILP